jgi:hypothetical protein
MSIFDRHDIEKVNKQLDDQLEHYMGDGPKCHKCRLSVREGDIPPGRIGHEHPEQCILALKVALADALKGIEFYYP